jgi:hypothetical protein
MKDDEYSLKQYPLVEKRLDPRAISTNQSGVTTTPLDGVSVILIELEIFLVCIVNIFFLLAFTRAGFDSQLTLNCSLH